MEWVHRTNSRWIHARKNYLTASDVKKLLPFTATGRKRSNVEEAYFEVWASKQFLGATDEQTVSTGMAARGHILEPYAIKALNETNSRPTFYHWDDLVLHDGVLGWSPDGLTLEQGTGYEVEKHAGSIKYCHGLEIKSYGVEKHLAKYKEPKEDHEERWQIATAFAVAKDMQSMTLLFFNPNCKYPMHYDVYQRDDLRKEIAQVMKIRSKWIEMKDMFDHMMEKKNSWFDSEYNEFDIMMLEHDNVINPN